MTTLAIAARLAAALLLAAPAAAGPVGEYQVKAAFLKNLTRFVERPGGTGDWTICVHGEDPFGAARDAIAGDAGGGVRLAVRRVRGGEGDGDEATADREPIEEWHGVLRSRGRRGRARAGAS